MQKNTLYFFAQKTRFYDWYLTAVFDYKGFNGYGVVKLGSGYKPVIKLKTVLKRGLKHVGGKVSALGYALAYGKIPKPG